LKGGRKKGNI